MSMSLLVNMAGETANVIVLGPGIAVLKVAVRSNFSTECDALVYNELTMNKRMAQALICQLADAFGMSVEINRVREGKGLDLRD